MKHLRTISILLTLLALTVSTLGVTPAQAVSAAAEPQPQVVEASSMLQFTSGGHALGFTADGMYAATGSHALHVDFVGANKNQPQSNSPASADGQAAALNRVAYANLWDGVTLVYAAGAGSVYATTYTLVPGADAKNIRLRYNAPVTVNKNGTLNIAFETGALTESAPIAWQDINGRRVNVDVTFSLSPRERGRGEGEISFALGKYNPGYPLTIDPTLTWTTFLGGSGQDYGNSIAVSGTDVYVTGASSATWGCVVPSPPCTVQAYTASTSDAFVAKLDSSGALTWNTFLGGSGLGGIGADGGNSIAVDSSGNVYVSGTSGATWGSPVLAHYGSGQDAFAAKLNPSGALQWNTFLGGMDTDVGRSIALDGSGNVYVGGESNRFWGNPVRAYSAFSDAFVAKLNSTTGALQWNTFLGGMGYDNRGGFLAVDGGGNVYVGGNSYTDWGCVLPSLACTVRAKSGSQDAFAAKLDPSGALQWNTFLGGSIEDYGRSIAVDGSGNVYVGGDSGAAWGCVSPSCTVRAHSGGATGLRDVFAAKLDSTTGVLTWNTFLGSTVNDDGYSIAVDGSGNVYVGGESYATWGCASTSCTARAYSGGDNVFAAKLDSSGALQWNTFLGGSIGDYGRSIAVDGSGNVYVGGYSDATWGSPVVRAYTAGTDAFVAVLPPYYTVTFDPNGGAGTMSAQIAGGSTALTTNAFTRTGYTFAGWNTVALGGGTPYADSESYPFTADDTLYAQWTINTYTVTYDAGLGSGSVPIDSANYNIGDTVTVLFNLLPTRTGYDFAGWSDGVTTYTSGGTTSFTMGSSDITLTAQFQPYSLYNLFLPLVLR
ncbi:SBBP repeat-containing protein [Patescibacteria group bacterium]|nr:SBBP repeat-containing protein [Patescibacteria group bacterium]